MNWYKGNIHCHSTNGRDGELSPYEVGKHYKDLGYDFLGISDHNIYTPVEEYNNDLLGIPSCEYTGDLYAHVLSIGSEKTVKPSVTPKSKVEDCLTEGVELINEVGGIPVLCHPLWKWTWNAGTVKNINNWKHFEICNAGSDANSFPLPGFTPVDDIWDELLSDGHKIYGIASDDAHHYTQYSPRNLIAGKGWIMTYAPELTIDSILRSFNTGGFYATTGIILRKYNITENKIDVDIEVQDDEQCLFEFIGENGNVLKKEISRKSEYQFSGNEKYVRLRISSTSGFFAWTQPIFLNDLNWEISFWV